MGRKPHAHNNLPPNMRKRVRKYGTYYFLDTGAKPRKEIPLGTDYILALKKYAELHQIDQVKKATFGDVITKYEVEVLPTLASNTIRIQRSDIKHVRNYFASGPVDLIEPRHIKMFLNKHKATPTTANRCKRLVSSMWNYARGWGYTNLPNPCEGIKGHKLDKRTVYITDEVFNLVHGFASAPLQDALDLAYLTGQRPADALAMSEHDIVDGCLIVTQIKTKAPLRITIEGKLAEVISRIRARKAGYKILSSALLVNTQGKRLTQAVLRNHFVDARLAAGKQHPELAEQIAAMWFYDLRAKAADDTADDRGEQAASDLLGHDSVRTTQRHYLRRGKVVAPVK
jgi:integrase